VAAPIISRRIWAFHSQLGAPNRRAARIIRPKRCSCASQTEADGSLCIFAYSPPEAGDNESEFQLACRPAPTSNHLTPHLWASRAWQFRAHLRSTTPMSYWPCKSSQNCAVAEVAAEPHRCVSRDRATKVENVSDAAGGNANIQRQPVGAELAGHQFAFQQAAGVYDGSHDVQPLW
jgi:hypothetical protein